jgi:hypothetical protein
MVQEKGTNRKEREREKERKRKRKRQEGIEKMKGVGGAILFMHVLPLHDFLPAMLINCIVNCYCWYHIFSINILILCLLQNLFA